MRRAYCHCGAPMCPTLEGEPYPWCRVCWVMRMGSTMDMGGWPRWTSFPPTQRLSASARAATDVDDCNSTEGTAATSTWLPPGAAPPEDRRFTRFESWAPTPQPRRLDTDALAEALGTAYPGTRWFAWHDHTRLGLRLQARRGGLAVDGMVSLLEMHPGGLGIMSMITLQAERMMAELDDATIKPIRAGGFR